MISASLIDPPSLFDELLSPISWTDFCDKHWAQEPLHVAHHESFFDELLSVTELERAIRTEGFFETRAARLRGRDYGAFEHPKSFKEACAGIEDGKSLQLRKMEQFLDPTGKLLTLARDMERKLRHPLESISCYLAPPSSFGLGPHLDETEIFTLQISGRKRWKLYHRVTTDREQTVKREQLGPPSLELTLEAGDFFYHPRGLIHEVSTVGVSSLSVTLVFAPRTWRTMLEAFVSALASTPEFLEALPAGPIGPAPAAFESKKALIERALSRFALEDFRRELGTHATRTLPDFVPGELEKALRIGALTVGSLVHKPETLRLERKPDRLLLTSRSGSLDFPTGVEVALEFVCSIDRPFLVLEIPGLDAGGRVWLAKRLLHLGALAEHG
ncbi:MAG: hypothetical protein HY791_13160 [Deltaproteobacteria bacterium]|nr:hypothetical protein [Deltaproteobacteria bacterium]